MKEANTNLGGLPDDMVKRNWGYNRYEVRRYQFISLIYENQILVDIVVAKVKFIIIHKWELNCTYMFEQTERKEG